MSKDNNQNNEENKEELNEKEVWDQEIYEEDGSRTNRRTKSEKRTWFVVSIIVILFLIVLIPTGAIIYSQMNGNLNSGKTAATSSSVTVVSSSSTKESETQTTESSTQTTESSSTVQSTSESFADVEVPKDDPSTRGQVAQNEADQNTNTQTQDQTGAATQNPGGSTVAYGQGDSSRSLWKISQEAGISLDQLYQLNPGVTAENVQPGQPIRVK